MNRIVLLSMASIILFAGCKEEPDNNIPEVVDENKQVIVSFSTQLFYTQPVSNFSLKSTATMDENSITKIILFGIDEQGNVFETYEPLSNSSLPVESVITISKKVKALYAIANPTTEMESANTPLMDLLVDYSKAPKSPFVMSGYSDITDASVDIKLVRSVAKVEIKINNLDNSTVSVQNTPNKGFVFKQETLSVPTSAARISYSSDSSSESAVFYVAENTSSDTDATQFVVTGVFNGKQANYTFALTSEKQKISIERNTHYIVNVSPITESECTAIISIPDWVDVILDDHVIPDENFEL